MQAIPSAFIDENSTSIRDFILSQYAKRIYATRNVFSYESSGTPSKIIASAYWRCTHFAKLTRKISSGPNITQTKWHSNKIHVTLTASLYLLLVLQSSHQKLL